MKIDNKYIVYLPYQVFLRIHETAAEKLKQLYQDKEISFNEALRSTQNSILPAFMRLKVGAYGKTKDFGDKPTIQNIFNGCPSIKKFKETFGLTQRSEQNLLYNCRLFFTKTTAEPMQISLEEVILLVLLLEPEMEIDEKQQFIKRLETKGYWVKSQQLFQTGELKEQKINYGNLAYDHYIGLFFSVLSFEVRYLLLSVSESEVSVDKSGRPYYAVIEKGLHDLRALGNQLEQKVFRGKGYLSKDRNHMQATLFNDNHDLPVNIQWSQKGEKDKKDKKNTSAFRGTAQAVSGINGRMLCLEIVFYRIETELYHELSNMKEKDYLEVFEREENKHHYSNILAISKYVSFQRRLFASRLGYIPFYEASDQLDIKARKVHIGDFSYLEGTYRLLQLGFNGRLFQSKLEIKQEGTGLLFVENEINSRINTLRLRCTLQPAQIPRPSKVIVVAYYQDSMAPSNLAVLDFDSRGPIYEGVFSSVGFDREGVFGEYFVFRKDHLEFETKSIAKDDRDAYLENEGVRDLLEELLQLHDRKHRYLPGWNMDSV